VVFLIKPNTLESKEEAGDFATGTREIKTFPCPIFMKKCKNCLLKGSLCGQHVVKKVVVIKIKKKIKNHTEDGWLKM